MENSRVYFVWYDSNIHLLPNSVYWLRSCILFSDLDECSASIPVCDANADCKNTAGSYRCTCKAGFTGDGKTCSGKSLDEYSII